MLPPKSHSTTILLAALVAIGPLATDIYLPAIPAIARAFDAGADKAQLTLSVFLLGFAVSQLIYGPVADRFGRRVVFLTGLVLFVVGYTLACSFVYAGLFAFISGSSFVLIRFLGVSEQHYGLYFMLVVLGYIIGTLFSGRMSPAWGNHKLMLLGSMLASVAGISMAALAAAGVYHVAAVVGPHVVFMISVGIIMPQAMAGAIGPFPRMAGSASALLGFIQMSVAAAAGALVGQFDDGTSHSMAFVIGMAGLCTLASFLFVVRPYRYNHGLT